MAPVHRGTATFFAAVALVFVYTISVTILDRPEGLLIALVFVAIIVVISLVSRITRSTELRVQRVTFDETACELLDEVLVVDAPVRFIANKIQAGDDDEYDEKSLDVRVDNHLDTSETAVFLEVAVTDASDFTTQVEVTAARVGTTGCCGRQVPASPTCWPRCSWRSASATTCPRTSTSSGRRRARGRTRCASSSPARATSLR